MVNKHLPVVPVAITLLKKDLISGTLFLLIMKGYGAKITAAKTAAAKITAAVNYSYQKTGVKTFEKKDSVISCIK